MCVSRLFDNFHTYEKAINTISTFGYNNKNQYFQLFIYVLITYLDKEKFTIWKAVNWPLKNCSTHLKRCIGIKDIFYIYRDLYGLFFCLSALTAALKIVLFSIAINGYCKWLPLWVSISTLNFGLMGFLYRSVNIASEI